MADDSLDARLRAVERQCTETDPASDDASLVPADRLDDVERRLSEAERRLDALDAAVQSVRGYVGAVEHVNEAVERRADTALAVAERLEAERPPDTDTRPDPPEDGEGRPEPVTGGGSGGDRDDPTERRGLLARVLGR